MTQPQSYPQHGYGQQPGYPQAGYQHGGYAQPGYPQSGQGLAVYEDNGRMQIFSGEQQYKTQTVKHTGLLVLWFNQQSSFTGTHAQVQAHIWKSLIHCLLLGWWSILSIVLYNWVAIFQNVAALVALKRQAQAVQAYWASQHQQPSQYQQPSASRAEYGPPHA
jgi:hypothetical protein